MNHFHGWCSWDSAFESGWCWPVCTDLTQPCSLGGRFRCFLCLNGTVPHMNFYVMLDILKVNFSQIPSMFTTILHKNRSYWYPPTHPPLPTPPHTSRPLPTPPHTSPPLPTPPHTPPHTPPPPHPTHPLPTPHHTPHPTHPQERFKVPAISPTEIINGWWKQNDKCHFFLFYHSIKGYDQCTIVRHQTIATII